MLVSFEKVSKSFEKKKVLEELSLSLSEGRMYGLLGKNGSGKSTIINLVLQFLFPDKGKIKYDGEEYASLPKKIKQKIGLLTEDSTLLEELNASQYLKFLGQLYGLQSSDIKNRSGELLEYFFDEMPGKKKIAAFSTGMKKMIGICGAVMHQPEFLLLDEPFSGLDVFAAKKVIDLLKQYQNESRTVLVSSHNMSYLSKIVSDVLVLEGGSIVFDGSLDDFTKNAKGELENQFLEFFPKDEKEQKSIKWL